MYSFNLLSTYYVPSIILDLGDKAMKNTDESHHLLYPQGLIPAIVTFPSCISFILYTVLLPPAHIPVRAHTLREKLLWPEASSSYLPISLYPFRANLLNCLNSLSLLLFLILFSYIPIMLLYPLLLWDCFVQCLITFRIAKSTGEFVVLIFLVFSVVVSYFLFLIFLL